MVQQAKYEVLRKIGIIEIRRYPKILTAKVENLGDEGFNLLLNFISGSNKQKANVSMTAPVIAEQITMTAPVLSETDSLSFIMPEEYTIKTIPHPIDERVKIVQIPERIVGVMQFSGRWSNVIFKKKAKELLEELKRADVKVIGEVFSMRYNSPYTPWFMRRNEVAVPIETK